MRSAALLSLSAAMLLAATAVPCRAEAAPADPKATFAKQLDDLLPDFSSADLRKRGDAQRKFNEVCLAAGRPGAETERAALCAVILTKLGPETAEEGRVWLLRQLQYIGGAESVPAVAKLLDDSVPRVRECARRALEDMPVPEAVGALRAALAKATTSEQRVAMVNALASRRDAASVDPIAKLLTGRDDTCALAAAAALGKIAGPQATAALAAARPKADGRLRLVVEDAYLRCADALLADGKPDGAAAIYREVYAKGGAAAARLAGLRGLCVALGPKAVPTLAEVFAGKDEAMRTRALAFVQEIPGAEATQALADVLPRFEAPMQAAVLLALGERGDKAARPAVLAATKHADESVRTAALTAMAGVGDAADVLVLAETAAKSDGKVRDAARASLARLRDPKADDAMIAALANADAKVKLEMIDSLAARRAKTAVPTFIKLAQDADDAARGAAVRGLESVGDASAVGLLIGIIRQPKQGADRDAAERALSAICARAKDRDALLPPIAAALGGTSGDAKAALLRPLNKIGGEKAIIPLRAALKDADAKVKDAAVRVLAEWPDDAGLDDMLAVAKDDPNLSNRVLALRGYVNLARQRDRNDEQKLAMCQAAMAVATRPDEKKQVLGVLRDLRSVEALNLAAPLMDDPALQGEASSASVRIARSIGGKLPDGVNVAMKKAIEVTKDNRTRRDAESVLKKYADQNKK